MVALLQSVLLEKTLVIHKFLLWKYNYRKSLQYWHSFTGAGNLFNAAFLATDVKCPLTATWNLSATTILFLEYYYISNIFGNQLICLPKNSWLLPRNCGRRWREIKTFSSFFPLLASPVVQVLCMVWVPVLLYRLHHPLLLQDRTPQFHHAPHWLHFLRCFWHCHHPL